MTTPPTKSLALESLAKLLERGQHLVAVERKEVAEAIRRLAAVESELAALKEALRGLEPVGYVRPEVVALLIRGVRWGSERISPRADEEDGLTAPLYTLPPNLKG